MKSIGVELIVNTWDIVVVSLFLMHSRSIATWVLNDIPVFSVIKMSGTSPMTLRLTEQFWPCANP